MFCDHPPLMTRLGSISLQAKDMRAELAACFDDGHNHNKYNINSSKGARSMCGIPWESP